MTDDAERERCKSLRDTAIHRLDLIEQGARITYEDGTPVDMESERRRLEEVVADMDRRITAIEQRQALVAEPDDDGVTRH
jgi:hypothetical protein